MGKKTYLAVNIDGSNTLYLDFEDDRAGEYLMQQLGEFAKPLGSGKGNMEFILEEMDEAEFKKLDEWEP